MGTGPGVKGQKARQHSCRNTADLLEGCCEFEPSNQKKRPQSCGPLLRSFFLVVDLVVVTRNPAGCWDRGLLRQTGVEIRLAETAKVVHVIFVGVDTVHHYLEVL
jgi:hypothetical protein